MLCLGSTLLLLQKWLLQNQVVQSQDSSPAKCTQTSFQLAKVIYRKPVLSLDAILCLLDSF